MGIDPSRSLQIKALTITVPKVWQSNVNKADLHLTIREAVEIRAEAQPEAREGI